MIVFQEWGVYPVTNDISICFSKLMVLFDFCRSQEHKKTIWRRIACDFNLHVILKKQLSLRYISCDYMIYKGFNEEFWCCIRALKVVILYNIYD